MNKELQKLLKQINDKKNEVKSLVNDGKLDKARAAKEELVELQNRFDLLYDLDEDEQDGIENKVKDGTAKQVGGDVKPDKKEHREIICQHCQSRIPAQRGRRGRHQGVQGCTHIRHNRRK